MEDIAASFALSCSTVSLLTELGNETQSFLVFILGKEDDTFIYKMALDWKSPLLFWSVEGGA